MSCSSGLESLGDISDCHFSLFGLCHTFIEITVTAVTALHHNSCDTIAAFDIHPPVSPVRERTHTVVSSSSPSSSSSSSSSSSPLCLLFTQLGHWLWLELWEFNRWPRLLCALFLLHYFVFNGPQSLMYAGLVLHLVSVDPWIIHEIYSSSSSKITRGTFLLSFSVSLSSVSLFTLAPLSLFLSLSLSSSTSFSPSLSSFSWYLLHHWYKKVYTVCVCMCVHVTVLYSLYTGSVLCLMARKVASHDRWTLLLDAILFIRWCAWLNGWVICFLFPTALPWPLSLSLSLSFSLLRLLMNASVTCLLFQQQSTVTLPLLFLLLS